MQLEYTTLIYPNNINDLLGYNNGVIVMMNCAKLDVSHRKWNDFLDTIDDQIV